MSNLTYWEKRKAQQMFEYMATAEQTADEISTVYLKASRHISLDMDMIFERFMTKHKLSEAEAYRILNTLRDKTSLAELKEALKANGKKTLLAELEGPAYQARLERLKQLQNQMDVTMRSVYQQEKARSTSHYVDLANESYYRSIFEIQKTAGLGFGFNTISPEMIDRVINSKWSGANYSTRIWNNTRALSRDIKEELLISLMTGRTDRETADIIANKFAAGSSQARRLVRTESCNLVTQMDMIAYEECGIDTYVFVATLDLRTSSACRRLDGKRFKVSNQQPGENCPPMHPWCRSTTICDISDAELAQMQRRARDPVTGKTNLVPANMSYEQWHKKYVAGNPEMVLKEKMVKNQSSDRKQFERYKEALGETYVPKSIESFQKLKYTSSDEYGVLKAQVKGMSYYNRALENEPMITERVRLTAQQLGVKPIGLENRVKSKDSYLTKIRRKYDSSGNDYEVQDILRYTYITNPETLTDKTLRSIELYSQSGYNTIKVKNSWLDKRDPYNGINTTLRTKNGQAFEIQYHTPESFKIKDGEMHRLYEAQRLIKDTSSEEYIQLGDKMFELSDAMMPPQGIERVKNHG